MPTNKSTPHPHGTSVPNSLGTLVPHPHAESMLLYAQDAMETDRPWDRWQMKHKSSNVWRNDADSNLCWFIDWDYRRKPRTILINGIEVPEPVNVELDQGRFYCYPSVTAEDNVSGHYWYGDLHDLRFLERGLIHLTEENARKHAEALLSFTKK